MLTNQNPKTAAQIMVVVAVMALLLAFIFLIESCNISKPTGDYYWSQQQVDLRARHKADKIEMKRIADSLYKSGDSSCWVMQVKGEWCLKCKDSLKFSK